MLTSLLNVGFSSSVLCGSGWAALQRFTRTFASLPEHAGALSAQGLHA